MFLHPGRSCERADQRSPRHRCLLHRGWIYWLGGLLFGLLLASCGLSEDPDAAQMLARKRPLALPGGLTLEEYPISSPISMVPLEFTPLEGTFESVRAKRAAWRQERFPDNTFSDGTNYSMWAELGTGRLVATQFNDPQVDQTWITVELNGEEIYRLSSAPISPMNILRGLWAVGDSWVLESVRSTVVEQVNTVSVQAVGQIIQDGVVLNDQLGYQDMFGFQLMAGRPFYFFRQHDHIGFNYDGYTAPVSYTEIPRYNSWGLSELNPLTARDMVAFFAEAGDQMYYVEVGVYEEQK